jgi:hypothetical protein
MPGRCVSGRTAPEVRRGPAVSVSGRKRMSILKGSAILSRKRIRRMGRGYRTKPLLMTFAVLAFVVSCSTARSSQPRGSDGLSGNWRGSNGGLAVTIALHQSGDSVAGSGNFDVASNASLGCGGESLPPSGTVSMTGHLVSGQFQGRMSFADVWTPPYLGVVTSPDTLSGHFMSVDRGGCPLVLVRQR